MYVCVVRLNIYMILYVMYMPYKLLNIPRRPLAMQRFTEAASAITEAAKQAEATRVLRCFFSPVYKGSSDLQGLERTLVESLVPQVHAA